MSMEVKQIDGPVIIFESKDKRAKEKAMRSQFTAAAFLNQKGHTVIVVKCFYGKRPAAFARQIIADYKRDFDLKMRRVAENPNGMDVTIINSN